MAGSVPETRDPHNLRPSRATTVLAAAARPITEMSREVADLRAARCPLPFTRFATQNLTLRNPASPSTNCGSRAGRQIPSHRDAHQRSLRETPDCCAQALCSDALSLLRAALRETPYCLTQPLRVGRCTVMAQASPFSAAPKSPCGKTLLLAYVWLPAELWQSVSFLEL